MKNSDYTIYRGFHLVLNDIRDDDERVLLSYQGKDCSHSSAFATRMFEQKQL